jgi:hypothetical protein
MAAAALGAQVAQAAVEMAQVVTLGEMLVE